MINVNIPLNGWFPTLDEECYYLSRNNILFRYWKEDDETIGIYQSGNNTPISVFGIKHPAFKLLKHIFQSYFNFETHTIREEVYFFTDEDDTSKDNPFD